MNEQPTDEKFLDEQLGIGVPDYKPKYGVWNYNSIMHLCTIMNGTLHCDLGFTMKVLPRHRAAAKKKLLSFIEWWEKTPMEEIEAQTKKDQEELRKQFESMLSRAGGNSAHLPKPRGKK